jgi:hypothetical protein
MDDLEATWDVPHYFENRSSGHPRYPHSHLQSPIRPVLRKFFHHTTASIPKFARGCIANVPLNTETLDINSETTYGTYILQSGTEEHRGGLMSGRINKHYNDAIDAVLQSVRDVHQGCNFQIPVGEYSLRKRDKIRLTELWRWIHIRTSKQQLKVFNTDGWLPVTSRPAGMKKAWFCGYYLAYTLGNTELPNNYIFYYAQVMIICDTLSPRVLSLWHNHMLPEGSPGKLNEQVLKTAYNKIDIAFAIL